MLNLILATRNAHKVMEIQEILGASWQCLSLKDFPGAPTVVEDGMTFAANATKKAVALAQWLAAHQHASEGTLVLGDDSGLEVDALRGAPGIHSARFAALDTGATGNSADADNNRKLLLALKNIPPEARTARFRCVLALTPVIPCEGQNASPVCDADQHELATRLFEGVCEGRISFQAAGQGGFGYDPLFVPDGFAQTLAELGETTKNEISHRSKALQRLKVAFKS